MTPPSLPFAKMNGIGNSILVVDLRGSGTSLSPDQARSIGMEPSLHFDQLMAIGEPRTPGTDAYVEIFNIDGSRSGACGNGTRCVAWAMSRNTDKETLTLQTAGGDLLCTRLDAETFSVDMGPPQFAWRDIPLRDAVADTQGVALPAHPVVRADLGSFSAVSMGNPHAVFFVDDVAAIDLAAIGPALEHHPIFPERANISFAAIKSRTAITLRVWERSAGATLACGSAACATLVAAVRAGLCNREATVTLPGGSLSIVWRETDDHVVMSGGVTLEHEGLLPARLWAEAA